MDILTAISQPSEIPFINYGGCAIYAFDLFVRLKAKGYNPTIVYASRSHAKIEYEMHKKGEVLSCNHAMVRVNGEFYDGLGRRDKKWVYSTYRFFRPVTPQYVKMSIADPDGWSDSFQRANNMSGDTVIKKYLDSIFNQ